MFQLYSKGCEYTIRALIHIGADRAKAFTAKEVCRKARIPESYTRKTFQALVRGGFLKSVTGPKGGYRLTLEPEEITVLSIIQAVEGEETFSQCVMGLARCNDRKPCPLHFVWTESKEKMVGELQSKTLKDLIAASASRRAA